MILFKCMIADMRDKKIPNGRKYITGEYVGETTLGEQFMLCEEEQYKSSKIPSSGSTDWTSTKKRAWTFTV